MQTHAAILVELGKPLELVDLEIPALKPGQVLVEVAYSGVCHTQILEARGLRGKDPYLPHCLGHEGTGKVLEVGEGVSKVEPGDAAILSWMKGSGADVPGTVYSWGSRKVNAGGITTFSRHSVISENRLTRLPKRAPLDSTALIGCAVATGMGSVVNTLKAGSGQSVAVFGAGGVGLCAVAGAAAVGCSPVIAVDLSAAKLKLAQKLGATHTVQAGDKDPIQEIRAICPKGTDFAVEATGLPQVMLQALTCVRPQGGRAVVIGNAAHGKTLELDPHAFNQGKSLLGTWGGDTQPDRDFPLYLGLLAEGKLDLKDLIPKRYALADANKALDDLESGRAVRPLIDMSRG